MVFVPVANTAKMCIRMRLYGQQLCMTGWWKRAGGWDASSLGAIANAILNSVIAHLLVDLSESLLVEGVELVDHTTQGGLGVFVQAVPERAGLVASPSAPGNVALAVKMATGLTGRSNRGRNFVPGIPDSQVIGNQVFGTFRDHIVSDIAAIATDVAVEDITVIRVVASLYSGVDVNGKPIPRSAGVTHEITAYSADQDIDSQRRRLNGRGV